MCFFFRYICNHMVALVLVFKGTSTLFSKWLYQVTFPLTVWEGFLFSTPSLAFIVCRLLDNGCSDWCEVVPYCSLDLHFLKNNKHCWASFHVPLDHLCVFFFKKYLFRYILELGCFLLHWAVWAACIFWRLIHCQVTSFAIFSPFLWIAFLFCLWLPLLCKSSEV